MPEVDTVLLFFSSSLLLGLAPGPDNLFVLAQAAQRGPRAGVIVTLGLCSGLIVHTAAVALGLAALFMASAIAFTLLKFLGAAYLLFLAWQVFFTDAGAGAAEGGERLAAGQLYRRGIIMNLTNPKVSLFFLAFLPQFVDPAMGSVVLQIMLLGLLFILATILVFGAISLLAGGVGERLRRSQHSGRVLNYLSGTLFAGLALKLVLTER
ncbi:MAG: LysE family translocator [Gammaproteobacteria bacterium]|nr:LysE family translocator [Gammaproteobacteria bacterium]